MANIGLGIGGMTGKTQSALSFLNKFMEKNFPDSAILTSVAGGVPCAPTLKKNFCSRYNAGGRCRQTGKPLSGGGNCQWYDRR